MCVCQPGFLGSNCEVDVAVCSTGLRSKIQYCLNELSLMKNIQVPNDVTMAVNVSKELVFNSAAIVSKVTRANTVMLRSTNVKVHHVQTVLI